MAKVRVSTLAKELKVSSDALVQVLKSMEVPVKSHSSMVEDEIKDKVKKKLDDERAAIKEKYSNKESRLSRRTRAKRSAEESKASESKKEDEGSPDKPQPQRARAARTSLRDRRAGAKERVEEKKNEQEQKANSRSGNRNGGKPQGGNRPDNRGQGGKPQQGGNRPDNRGQGGKPQAGNRPDNRGQGDKPTAGNRPDSRGQGGSRPDSRGQGAGRPDSRGQGGSRPDSRGQGGRPDSRGQGSVAPRDKTLDQNVANQQAELNKAEDGAVKKKKAKKKNKKERYAKKKAVNEGEMKANIKKTLAKIGAGSTKKKYKKAEKEVEVVSEEEAKLLQVSEFISVNEFATMIKFSVAEVMVKCLEMGLFVTINQRLEFETIELLADEFGFRAELLEEFAEDVESEEDDSEFEKTARAPIVTVMGHVDHGKTSLLDYIRRENVVGGEAGGITQHIASYEVETKNGKVTFLDTPGHEAFAAMRARGSQITDVVVLIVAADSAVMPQTKEAIDHAKAADVPIVVAINKVDLPTANVDKIKAELAAYNLLVDSYGGQVSCVELSAKTGEGVDTLLETLALETEVLELQARKEGFARGAVIESELDKGRGAVATILIQKGTLKKGDPFVTGIHSGRVRELFNDRGQKIKEAGPSQPVMVLGLAGTPQAGDSFRVVDSEKEAKELSSKRRLAEKERERRSFSAVTLDTFFDTIDAGQIKVLNLIIKGDVDGSVEAVASSLEKLSTDEVKVNVILKGVGGIKESDIMLAKASNAILIGFHINPNPKIRMHAREAGVDIRTYRIIYEAVDEVKSAMVGMLSPDIKEEILGQVEIREVFKVTKIGQIAGCYVTDGKIERTAKVRLVRDDVEIADTTIDSLQRHKDQAKEVAKGFECGIMLAKVNEYKVGDRIEVYKNVEVKRTELERKPQAGE